MDLKIDRLKILLPGTKIKHHEQVIKISTDYVEMHFKIVETIEDIIRTFQNFELVVFLDYYKNDCESEHNVLSKYYSIVQFDTIEYLPDLTNILNQLIKNQKEKELLLEEVLRSKKNIDGLIENRLRSFIYYNIKLI